MGGPVGILSILSLRECGMCCHQSKPRTIWCSGAKSGGNILQTPRKTYLSSDSRNSSCWMLCGSRRTLHILRISSRRWMENSRKLHTAANALYGKSLTHLYFRMKRRSCEWRLNNFGASRTFQLIAESWSRFERSKVKGFIEVSPHRRALNFCRAQSREGWYNDLSWYAFRPHCWQTGFIFDLIESVYDWKEARKRKT